MHVDKVWRCMPILYATYMWCYVPSANADAPYVDPADDHKHFGSPDKVLFWTREEQVAGYRNSDRIFWTRAIKAGDSVYPLPYAKVDLRDVEIKLDDATMTVDEYFTKKSVAGLLVIKDGKILYERYGLGNTEDSKWVSYSVAKSVVSMLIGAAIQDGYIKSVDEKVTNYLPRPERIVIRSVVDCESLADGIRRAME